MAFAGLDFDEFSRRRQEFFHLRPIDQQEHLKGREKQLAQIHRNLDGLGRQIFIFGDRGVGKTSLARTAAFSAPGYKFDPIYVGCDREGSFFQMAAAMIDELAGRMDQAIERTVSEKASILAKLLGYERGNSEKRIYPDFDSLSRFIQALKAITETSEKPPIVIIDELERFTSDHDRGLMADFIKRVSDEKIRAKFILCGIASGLSELIGNHPSAERSFSPIELERLKYNNLQEVIESAADAFCVKIPKGIIQRISVISDGFPYYTQLVGDQLFWIMYEDDDDVSACSEKHFQDAIDRSVDEALFTLREKYEKATLKYRNTNDFKYTLWSLVSSPTLSRQVSEIYDKSYLPLLSQLKNGKVLSSHEFNSRMWYLTQDSHGSILTARGSGWYEFTEKMMRGYVRLKAQEAGVVLGSDIHQSDVRLG
jgi:uncharacterized protein